MSKKDFESKQTLINSIPEKGLKQPNIPVDKALQESEDLYVWCQADKEILIKAGLDWSLVDDLPIRTGACRYIQSNWQNEYRNIEAAQKEWKEQSPAAYELRNELLHHFYYAFQKQPALYAQTKKISEGGSHTDMIQDLSDLSILGKANVSYLKNTLLDIGLLDKAAETAGYISELLAKSNKQKMENRTLKIVRDKAYAHMKEAVDEIRRCGQYVFWKNEQRKKGYISKYNKTVKKNSKNKLSKTEI